MVDCGNQSQYTHGVRGDLPATVLNTLWISAGIDISPGLVGNADAKYKANRSQENQENNEGLTLVEPRTVETFLARVPSPTWV